MKTVEERKFRGCRGGVVFCDKCGSRIEADEWFFRRRKYEILKDVTMPLFGRCPVKRILEEAKLCRDCVPREEILKKDRR